MKRQRHPLRSVRGLCVTFTSSENCYRQRPTVANRPHNNDSLKNRMNRRGPRCRAPRSGVTEGQHRTLRAYSRTRRPSGKRPRSRQARVAPSPEAGPSAAALQRRRGPAARGSHPDGFPVPPHPRARTPTPTPFLGTRTAASPQQPGILLAASRRHPGGAALRARPSAQAQRLPARRGDAALPLGGRGREAGERSAARGGGRSGGCVPELATP